MKNIKYLLLILPFMFISNVKADVLTKNINLMNDNFNYERNKSFYENHKDILLKLYDDVYSYYLENYKSDYPYYIVYFHSLYALLDYPADTITIYFYLFDTIPNFSLSSNSVPSVSANYKLEYSYRSSDSSYILPISVTTEQTSFGIFGLDYLVYNEYFYSNFDLIINLSDSNSMILNYEYSLPSTFKLSYVNGDTFIPLQEAMGLDIIKDPDLPSSGYQEVNLNDYPYIALSLKDYNKTDSFDVNNYVKGQYCITPVYDYGLKERKEVLSGTQVERCSPYYTDYTLVRTTILNSDLKNHAIYYLKAYDTSKENKVKIDTSVFNIHYITEEDKNNPILNINGTKYSAIPFNSLTDTANKSEDEGYASGAVKEFDFDFSDIFSAPLDFMKKIWSSITQVFLIIIEFISLLPETLQYFLYISFILAIILGLIKIIL